MSAVPPNAEPQIAIAVLFERLGHMMEKVDNLSAKIDAQDAKRTEALGELESRVEHIERQMSGIRWFLAGVAAAGGALGGTIAGTIAKMIGG